MSGLKPCPFCGGEAVLHNGEYSAKLSRYKKEIPKGARIIRSTTYPSGTTWHEYRVRAYIPQCSVTGCLGRVYRLFETQEEAIEAWNNRAAKSPCDLCRYNPPSSGDGKPCSMCVADGGVTDGN